MREDIGTRRRARRGHIVPAGIVAAAAALLSLFHGSAGAAEAAGAASGRVTVTTSSPRGEVQRVRQARLTFSAPMVPVGDPRQPAPVDVRCVPAAQQAGSGRWVDDRSWVWDFTQDLGPGTRCTVSPHDGLKSLAGEPLAASQGFGFRTGGPAIVRATPRPDQDESARIEEQQAFALLLNGAATAESIQRHAWCEISGVGERVPVKVWSGPDRDAIVRAAEAQKQSDRFVVLSCTRPAPPDARLTLVWGPGIAAAGGGDVTTSVERRLTWHVRPAFTASFTCQRENSRADCLPLLPLRVEFSSPVPKSLAAKVRLHAPDGDHAPRFETGRGATSETDVAVRGPGGLRGLLAFFTRSRGQVGATPPEEAVTAVDFPGPLPEQADLRIDLPPGFVDESGRPLSNASLFPLSTRTGRAPPLVKFPGGAAFGILELNADPVLPVTVRHVEGDLAARALTPGAGPATAGPPVKDLAVDDDVAIMRWMARLKRYDETSLPREQVERELGIHLPPPPRTVNARPTRRYGEAAAPEDDDNAPPPDDARNVQTRTVSLLDTQPGTRRLQLPAEARTEPHPFEVVGLPLPVPGYHVVEIASPRLGRALLDREAPMYVRTGVLVTNLGVHFKWGAVNSAVWVTTLDHARPVPDADVRIADCRGRPVWRGRTDAHGVALVPRALPAMGWDTCHGGEDEPAETGYFVSARKTDTAGRADMAFVWSTWQQGIESWRFNLRQWEGREADAPVFHTVMDRTLLRAGQTVSFKHYGRRQLLSGLGLPEGSELPTTLQLIHEGSGQKFSQPVQWRQGRWAENTFRIPEDAKLGVYDVQLSGGGRTWATGSFRVEEFRLPVMTGRIVPPAGEQVAPASLPVQVEVAYGNGGGASGLPVRVSAQLRDLDIEQAVPVNRYPGFRFALPRDPSEGRARSPFREEYVDEDDDAQAVQARAGDAKLVADKRPLVLDRAGAGRLVLESLPPLRKPAELLVQANYADPNGEVQTLSQTVPLWPSAVVLGVKADDWVSVGRRMATQVLALDTAGRPKAGVAVTLRAVAHRNLTARKRLVGGFYAYDDRDVDEDLGSVCTGTSDARGLVFCEVALSRAGNVELVAEAQDAGGHPARGAASVWITGQDEIWFGSQNDDRMDVVPEKRSYQPGETARFQVRSPFRHATVLVAVERNGVMRTEVREIDGKDPVLELKVEDDWSPNVFVSVLAVRGRVREVPWYSFFSWGWRSPGEWWRSWRQGDAEWQAPTAMVDLSRPAFRLGVAEIEVGRAGHTLQVQVTPDQARYPIRATSHVRVHVALPGGRPAPAGTEVAVAAVDEALLALMPNDSWNLLDAMLKHRAYGVETATAQMQIIGKRHFGKKAAPPGGGGGQFPTRELFDTLLLWNPRVVLDAQGNASVDVPLNDALTSFRIVAVADVVQGDRAGWFGTGQATIRATQDLQVVSGLPPLVRTGDHYDAMFTLRNTTPRAIVATVRAQAGAQALPDRQVTIGADAAVDLRWEVDAPSASGAVDWSISAEAGAARDRLKVTQKVIDAVPVRVQQATLRQLEGPLRVPVAPPAGALADAQGTLRGGIDLGLRPRLADGLDGLRDFFQQYPWNCLEQRASVAIGLQDPAAWKQLMARLPLYLDADGLAHYFPPGPGDDHGGSDTLTAYLLSVSDEATRAGLGDFAIPEESRDAMERGLIGFVEGRLRRDFWAPAFLRHGDLDVRKLAALEALSRRGKASARLLDSVQLLPDQWPTGAVIDWLQVLQRVPDVPDRAHRLEQAEQVLRARLDVQGTRLGFSTERDDSWWWLMTDGDVNSVRMILAVVDRPGWKEDLPRLVTGTLQRQQAGRWSTTVANAWGRVAMQAFSRRFEREPVTGLTRAGVEGAPPATWQVQDWSRQPSGGVLSMGWPRAAGPAAAGASSSASATMPVRGPVPLAVTQEGGGHPWVTITSRAAVPMTQAFSSGYRITKTVTPVENARAGGLHRGDVVRVTLQVDVQADATWVVVDDPVPAGAALLGTGLGRDDAIATRGEREDGRGWLAWQERSTEAFRAYYRYLPKGRFQVEYTMRLNNPGRFQLPATRVQAMYAPEMHGEAPNAAWTVLP